MGGQKKLIVCSKVIESQVINNAVQLAAVVINLKTSEHLERVEVAAGR